MRLDSIVPVMVRNLAATLAVAASFLSPSVYAASLTVDGDISDLVTVVNTAPWNVGSASEPLDPLTENNGFDIVNAYAHYDQPTDTFFLGMDFVGQVGTSGGDEGSCFFCPEFGVPSVFDSNETYGFNIIRDSDATTLIDLRLTGNSGTGGETISSESNLFSATRTWSVSEANNGVEFSVTGLLDELGNFSFSNPTDLTIGFFAGSFSNDLNEDELFVNMQVVPVPAAVWLFGTGVLALVGTARRRQN